MTHSPFSICALTICFFLATAHAAEPPAKRPLALPADFEAKAGEYMDARIRASRFSGAVLIAVDGKSVFRRGYGFANRDHDVPNTPKTKFRIGSVTKQFTAVAVLALEEQGKLKLADPIGNHLPNCPKAWAGVNLHQLLSHTSGVPEHTLQLFLKGTGRSRTLQEIVDLVKDKPLDFTPGEKFKYSNTGYILLGQIIEAVSGRTFGEHMASAVFGPLGMKDTGVEKDGQILPDRAIGYARKDGGIAQASYLHMSAPSAAGAMYSTADDLLLWDRALASHKLIGAATTAKLFTPVKDDYAYGFDVGGEFGRPSHSHGGGIPGFQSFVARYPDQGLFVAVLWNFEPVPAGVVGNELSAIALGEPYALPRERKAVKPDPAALPKFVGDYMRGKENLTIRLDGDALEFAIGGKGFRSLVHDGADRFFVLSMREEVDFRFHEEKGKVTDAILRRNGIETKWQRNR